MIFQLTRFNETQLHVCKKLACLKQFTCLPLLALTIQSLFWLNFISYKLYE